MSSEPLRILHLLSYHLYTGPAEPVLTLARAQRQAGHDARLAVDTHREGDIEERAGAFGVPVERRFALSVKAGPILLLRDLLAFKRLWAEGTCDILHAHRSHDHTLAALARPRRAPCRLVRTLHTERSLDPRRDWQLRRADGLVTVARGFKRRLVDRGILPDDLVASVEGAVDSDRFRPGTGGAGLRAASGIGPRVPVAGIVARMRVDRDHALLLRAWARVVERLTGVHLMIAGRGEEESDLRSQVASASWASSVTFLGYRDDLPDVYQALDLKVLLAPGNDGTCRAALEAMSSGVPVLAFDRGALAEIVEDGRTGRVVPAGDEQALAEALTELLVDRDRLQEMGEHARQDAVSRFTIDRQAESIERLYRRLMSADEPRLRMG